MEARLGFCEKSAKLTEDDVRLIRDCVKERERLRREIAALTNKSLSKKFEVTKQTIEKIAQGRSWRHLQGEENAQ